MRLFKWNKYPPQNDGEIVLNENDEPDRDDRGGMQVREEVMRSLECKTHVQLSYDNLCSTIFEAAKKLNLMKITSYSPTSAKRGNEHCSKPWYDLECLSLKKQLKNALKIESKFNYIEIKKKYKTLLKLKKHNYESDIIMTLSNARNSKDFWLTVNKYRGHKKNASLPIVVWEYFMDSMYPPSLNVNEAILFDARYPLLDAPITSDETYSVLSLCKNRKSPGVDSITYEFLKNLPYNWILYLTSLFNRIFETAIIPTSWSEILLAMIHKGGDINEPSNYRGLAMLNCPAKLFTSILLKRLSTWCEEFDILPESQAGFRTGRGCVDNVYTLSSVIQSHIRHRKSKIFTIFVDFKRAFDSIKRELLWFKLFSLGVTSSILRVVQNLEMAYITTDKAKQAVGAIIPIMSKTKIDTWHPRIKLFESLALSTMSNCAPVWAIRYAEHLERDINMTLNILKAKMDL
ncbi:hypothetical protein NQ317_004255 [Molorchus minor]|uniref:Reverse transcriptase domain-containing protein n=1 Tax=Molorchus minor TaxID=1323400 RepID=A0ABQ9K211_9CUCU|nr:hypothetical protein NQ317_004255 [Molorchus minor]